jgi:hypothetical protein
VITLLADDAEALTVSKVVTIVKNGYTANLTAGTDMVIEDTADAYAAKLNPYAGVAMDLGNTLQMNFVVDTTKLTGNDNYAIITRYFTDGSYEVTDPIPQSTWTPYSKYFQFSYGKIAAKEMTDVLEAVIYNADGVAISVVKQESTRSYIMRNIESLLSKASLTAKQQKQVTMLVDVLNYGAAAQQYFKYNADDLANSLLTDELIAKASENQTAENVFEKNTYCPGTALFLQSRIELRVMINNSKLGDVAYAIVHHSKHGDKDPDMEYRVEKADFQAYNKNISFVPVTTLSGADGDQLVTVTFYTANGDVVTSVVETMNSNLSRSIAAAGDNLNLAHMLLRMTKSAYAYFHA